MNIAQKQTGQAWPRLIRVNLWVERRANPAGVTASIGSTAPSRGPDFVRRVWTVSSHSISNAMA